MRAAVTQGESAMELSSCGPGEPGEGEVVLRPEVVGVCGSDVHLFHGRLGQVFPRIQGHEISAVVEAVGPGSDHVRPGDRVAVWPVLACGACYPCSIGRENVCANIAIIGAHVDGALQERLCVPASQVFAVGDMAPAVTAFVEPASIGVRTVVRARVSAGDRVVVLGAGPIGQAVCLAARDRGAAVLLADRVPERLEHARAMGAQEVVCGDAAAVADEVREWAGGDGVAVLIETTGVPGGGAQRHRDHRAGRPAGARRALPRGGQPPAGGLPDQGARRPRRELLQRERVRRRGRPRPPPRGRRRAADHRRVRLRAGARGVGLRRRRRRRS